jgi:hypothetical protein
LSDNFLGWKWISWLISFQLIEILCIYLWLLNGLGICGKLYFKNEILSQRSRKPYRKPSHFEIIFLSWIFSSLCYWLNQEESDKPFSFYLPLWDPQEIRNKIFFLSSMSLS